MVQPAGIDHQLLEIYSELNRDRLIELVVNYARDRLNAGGSSLFLRDNITGRYVLRGTTGISGGSGMPEERIEYEPGEGLTGWVAKHGRPLRIANVTDSEELRRVAKDLVWSKKYSEVTAKPDRAYLGVPILSRDGGTVLGVLRVSGGDYFSAQDEALLSQVAAMVGIAIENSQRYEREKRRARYLRMVVDISAELSPQRSLGDMLKQVAERVREGFRAEACQIYLRTEEDVRRIMLWAASGLPEVSLGRLSYMEGEGLIGHIVAAGEVLQLRAPGEVEAWRDPHLAEIAVCLPSGVCRSFLGIPLRLGDQVLGAIALINKIPSAPGHRDWFTDDDEEYLRLLSTSICGVLESARYLKTLNEVGVTAMRMQRAAAFGALAQRIQHEAANPLAVARLALTNLGGDIAALRGSADAELVEKIARRVDIVGVSLNEIGDKMLELLEFSQHMGFTRVTAQWNDIVREALIWLAAERQRRGVQVRVAYGDLPLLFIEPNELFGVLGTVMRLAMEALGEGGGLVKVRTCLEGERVCTDIEAVEAREIEKVLAILNPAQGAPESLSPLYFEWALARETVESQYEGSLAWQVDGARLRFRLGLAAKGNDDDRRGVGGDR